MDVHRLYKGTLWSSFDAMANNIELIPRLGTLTQIVLLALNSMKLEVG